MEEPYKNREIDEKMVDISKRFDAQDKILLRIETQTIKTNGRVSKLEQWQSYVLGFCACLTIILIPILFKLFVR